MAQFKRNENIDLNTTSFHIYTPQEPPKKRAQLVAWQFTASEMAAEQTCLVSERKSQDAAAAQTALRRAHEEHAAHLGNALHGIKDAGFGSLAEFLVEMMHTTDQQHSAHISRTLGTHGQQLLEGIHIRQPGITNSWVTSTASQLLINEGKKLAAFLHPPSGQEVSELLSNWSLERILVKAKKLAPTLCTFLCHVSMDPRLISERRDLDLVCIPCIRLFT
ncbi:hypothetical protein DFJ58DRAFT_728906 [Suillus subalutaceus]|uniref:uncharacterized protein n=1 Tax=Suillus subalutaceus TaxID=48586 RepID=UPI001B86D4E9|nr:uncharacterized protein DFJ58DRAFT_728906 [Suillus subalutaceus]KAG1851455.1 hypothetical protein DFJ58DRAFT_728906 [Suillus subalutaceus]